MSRHVVFGTGQVGHPLIRQLIAERDRRMGEWKDVIASSPVVDDDLSTAPGASGGDQPHPNEEPF